MRALPTELRGRLESAVLAGRRAAETGVRAALDALGVKQESKPVHLTEEQARLRRGLRAKQLQLGGGFEILAWECAYEQWHRLLFARFLAENGLLRHPEFDAPVTLDDCDELADDLCEPDGWSVAGRFASEILPGIFRLDDPCLQLRLAPEHRMALENIVAGLPGEVFAADDSLGWVYQYWQKDRKKHVNASEVKIGGADLGPVTQLFTENYMVRFLLENSLGAWWAARHPSSPLIKEFEYLRFDQNGQPAAGTFEGWPDRLADVTVMDPCCGSGHFLVEAFGMLWRMRAEEEGLHPVAAQDAVLRDNLFGLELDPRCVQIAMFAVALTAWKQGGGWRQLPAPNVACSGIPVRAPLDEWTALAEGDYRLERALERLHTLFKDADTLGSLIDPRRAAELANAAAGVQRSFDDVELEEIVPLLEKATSRESNDPATAVLGADAAGIARAAELLSRNYQLVVTNVPYLKRGFQSENLVSFSERNFGNAAWNLATSMFERFLRTAPPHGLVSAVLPQSWLLLASYKDYRQKLLSRDSVNFLTQLGPGAFEAISGEIVNVVLLCVQRQKPDTTREYAAVDVARRKSAWEKAAGMQVDALKWVNQRSQELGPDSRITAATSSGIRLMEEKVMSIKGTTTGDDFRFKRAFWEFSSVPDGWEVLQASSDGRRPYGGLEFVLHSRALEANPQLGTRLQSRAAVGKRAVVINQARGLSAGLSIGTINDQNAGILLPDSDDPAALGALFGYCSSEEYRDNIHAIDREIKVTNATLAKVPYDEDRWRAHAVAKGALPEPWSDDPTQWLFDGRPERSTEPLQVAVSRLLGCRWPEQRESDDLDQFSDRDGMVCLPAVAGEFPATDRLQALLAQAYGDKWSPGLVRQLLDDAESSKNGLADWLRDEFFKHHCKVFLNRPFVWHVWDGRKDGFSALANYHRLDRTGLEKLTYTYLGDWIERQRADTSDEVAGADLRLTAARLLKAKLEAILEGEPPYDVYVRWKALHEQPIGWEPDIDDGVRLNIRPFVEAGVLRSRVNVHWKKDRGTNRDGSERHNDLHYTCAEKQQARRKAGKA